MKKTMIAAAVLAATYGVTAQAQTDIDNPTGFYVGGGFGQFSLDIEDISDVGSGLDAALDDNDNSYKFFAGYRFSPYIALEAAYVNLGKPGDQISSSGSNGRYSVEADGFAPSLIGTLPLGPFELFGKVGYYFYDVSARVDFEDGEVLTSDSSGDDFVYGGGIGITFLERLHVRAEYERFDIENSDTADALWLSAAWRF
jgi:OOP family OmpA-OmpF porin